MQYTIIPTPKFNKDLKKYRKKYRHIGNDIEPILESLENGNIKGKVIPVSLLDNNNVAIKLKVASSDMESGTSGSYRLIYYAEKDDGTIYLLTIYCKRDKENISNKEIQELILKYCV